MKKKIFSILLTLVLTLSLLMVVAVPVSASAVTSVWVEFPYADDMNDIGDTGNTYLVHFKPANALLMGVDYVTVTFPDGTSGMGGSAFSLGTVTASQVTFSTNYGTSVTGGTWTDTSATPVASGYRVKVQVPKDYAAGADVWIKFASSGITDATSAGTTFKMYVQTTKDTDPVLSTAFTLGATVSFSALSTAIISTSAGVAAQYTFMYTSTTQLNSDTDSVTVKLPVGTVVPTPIAATLVEFTNDDGSTWVATGTTPVVDVDKRTVTAVTSVTSDGNGDGMRILAGAGVLNPQRASTSLYKTVALTNEDGQYYTAGAHTVEPGVATQIIAANGNIGTGTSRISDSAGGINIISGIIFVTIGDTYGNAKATTATVALATSSSGIFYTNSNTSGTGTYTAATTLNVTTAGPATTAQQVYFAGTIAGTHTLTFSHASYANAEWTFTVAPGVELYDSSGNPVRTFVSTGTTDSELNASSGIGTDQVQGGDHITSAIAVAFPGDVIKVGPGTYTVNLGINQPNLTIESTAGKATTFIKGLTSLNAGADNFVLGGATGKGFTLQEGSEQYLVKIYGAADDVTISYNTFVQSRVGSHGIIVNSVPVTGLTVTQNTFTLPYKWGVGLYVTSDGTAEVIKLTATYNTFTGAGRTVDQSGIELHEVNISTYNTTISNNTFTAMQNGILIGTNQAGTGLISGSSPASLIIKDNTFTGLKYALDLVEAASDTHEHDVRIIKNTFTTNYIGIGLNKGAAPATDKWNPEEMTIKYNAFSGNTHGIYNNAADSAVLVAKYNWYGSATGPTVSTNPGGTGDAITVDIGSGSVTYEPWLHKSLADVVTDNASYPTFSRSLAVGWNTLSVPGKLIPSADALDELVPAGMTVAYKYDGGWAQVTTDVLNPLDGIYIKMASAQTVLLKVDGAAFHVPTKALAAGWTLMGLASLTSKYDSETVASIPSASFGQLVSPSMNVSEWAYVTGTNVNILVIGESYWIFMINGATIAGFTILPMAPDLD